MNDPSHASKSFFKSGRYGLFWISSLFSNIGTWMQQVAQPWVVLSLSNSPFWVGLDSFALNAPGWLFTLWGGLLADRYERRKTVLFFQSIQFLCVLAMVFLLVMGWLEVWMIVVISFLVGLTDSLSMPSFQSIIPSLVAHEDIHRAVSLNSTQFNLSRILGPAIAGVVIVRYGAIVCFSANAVSYIPFFLSLYFIYPRGGLNVKARANRDETSAASKRISGPSSQPGSAIAFVDHLSDQHVLWSACYILLRTHQKCFSCRSGNLWWCYDCFWNRWIARCNHLLYFSANFFKRKCWPPL